MTGLIGPDGAGTLAIWVAAVATLVAWSVLAGAHRPFTWAQRLLAGLLTGYLALIAIREVLVPRLIEPLLADPAGRPLLWLALLLAAGMAAARWLPRWAGALPIAVLVGATAAFALSGAMVGTVLPQLAGILPAAGASGTALAGGVATAAIASLVLLAFLHGRPAARGLAGPAVAGRWAILVGVGAWLGFLVLGRLTLLVDRLAFLAVDWLGLGR